MSAASIRRVALLIFTLVGVPSASLGELYYRWCDASGVIHVTNDPHRVPAHIRDSSQLRVRDFPEHEGAEARSRPSEMEGRPESKPEKVPSQRGPATTGADSVVYSPHTVNHIVVVQQVFVKSKRARVARVTPKRVAQRSFADRRFFHPSAFTGAPKLYIHPVP